MRLWTCVSVCVAAAIGLAACSSGARSSSTTVVHPGHATGLGSTSALWASTHPAGSSPSSFGPPVTRQGKIVDRYTSITTDGDRITGWDMAFQDGTKIAFAERAIGAELPADARQTASWRGTSSGGKSTCEFISLRSDILATMLANGTASSQAANIGLKMYELTPNSAIGPSIATVNSALVRAQAFPTTASC